MSALLLDQLVNARDASSLSDEHIRYFRDHPEALDLIGDRETLDVRHLWRILWIAAALVGLSKVLSVTFTDAFDQFLINVTVDLVFEMGAALIGSVATVIFIQNQQKHQFVENVQFHAEVQRRIDELNAVPDSRH